MIISLDAKVLVLVTALNSAPVIFYPTDTFAELEPWFFSGRQLCSQVLKSIHKQQTTLRKPIECAPAASSGGREWAEMTDLCFHLIDLTLDLT